jgi:hypothetical protein
MRTFNLEPVSGRKSFGNKARVIEENGLSQLESYNTIVAEYNHRDNSMKVFDYYSATTMAHINSFLLYYGFDTCSKKELGQHYLKN